MRPMLVECRTYATSTCWRWRRPRISSRSRHSRRTLPTQRSAWARAFGARTGALMTRMPSERKTSWKSRLNCCCDHGSRTAGGFRRRRAASAGCAPTGPLTVRIGRDSCEADASGCEFDEEQDVEPLQEERVDGEEVALEDARRLRPQEPRPALLDPVGCRNSIVTLQRRFRIRE